MGICTIGVPQGSVLGPTPFSIYVNDLPAYIENSCKLYADDCKILSTVESNEDVTRVQKDINAVIEWCSKSLMELNALKCKVMHCGKHNPSATYTIPDDDNCMTHTLEETNNDHLGIVSSDAKWNNQVNGAASKAKGILGLLRNTFVSRDTMLWKRLYTSYVRPHLEYAVAVWNPYLNKDIIALENVQRKATKIPHNMKGLTYEKRCKRFDLTSLVKRRTRGDLIQMFKIIKKFDILNWLNDPIQVPPRGKNRAQYRREIVKNCNKRHFFFINRICNDWNLYAFGKYNQKLSF